MSGLLLGVWTTYSAVHCNLFSIGQTESNLHDKNGKQGRVSCGIVSSTVRNEHISLAFSGVKILQLAIWGSILQDPM